jgi:hypothetical protein
LLGACAGARARWSLQTNSYNPYCSARIRDACSLFLAKFMTFCPSSHSNENFLTFRPMAGARKKAADYGERNRPPNGSRRELRRKDVDSNDNDPNRALKAWWPSVALFSDCSFV